MSVDASPFAEVPSALGIAHYLWEETDRTHGCDGIKLWRDGASYCYLWIESMVDHDMWIDYLIEVRTKVGTEDFNETRDYLFVSYRQGKMEAEWHNKPIRFDAPTDHHIDRLRDGLIWFAERVVGVVERAN